MDSRPAENFLSIPWIITAVITIAALYYSGEVMVPIVVAIPLWAGPPNPLASLLQEFSSAIESTEKPQQNQSLKSNGNATSANARQTKPVPVEIVGGTNNLNFQSIKSMIGPVVTPLLKMAIVFVVTAFMLFRRRDIQGRLFALWQFAGAADSMRALLDLAESDLILTSLGDSVVQIQQFVELQPQSAHEK